MYLSLLMLNPRHKRVQSELANPYEMHRTVLRAFPEDLPPEERVLYRIDDHPHTHTPALLVQSQTEPDWRWAQEIPHYLLCPAQTKWVDLQFSPGQVCAFRLRANPTIKKKSHEDERPAPANGVRLGLLREEEQRAWLERKGAQHGFRILQVVVSPEPMQVAFQPQKEGSRRRLAHVAVRYDGLLQVVDPDLLKQAIYQGIGSAKGFGFGLLSLGPARL